MAANLPPAIADKHRRFEEELRSAGAQLRRAEQQLLGALAEAPLHELERPQLAAPFRSVLEDSGAAAVAGRVEALLGLWDGAGEGGR